VEGLCSALCLEVVDRPLICVACFAQLLDMLLGDVLWALRSAFKQLETRCLAVPDLPFAALFLSLKILDQVDNNRLGTASIPLDLVARITLLGRNTRRERSCPHRLHPDGHVLRRSCCLADGVPAVP